MEGVLSYLERRDPAWTVSKNLDLPKELRT
jgi:hypothetical protein